MSAFKQGDRVRVNVSAAFPDFDGISLHSGQEAVVDFTDNEGAALTFDDGFASYAFDVEMEVLS